jgi:hypothetical protein
MGGIFTMGITAMMNISATGGIFTTGVTAMKDISGTAGIFVIADTPATEGYPTGGPPDTASFRAAGIPVVVGISAMGGTPAEAVPVASGKTQPRIVTGSLGQEETGFAIFRLFGLRFGKLFSGRFFRC